MFELLRRIFFPFLVFFFSGASICTFAQFEASKIPEDLKKNAQMIIRKSEETFTIISDSEARLEVEQVYTVLKPEGDREASLLIFYDDASKVSQLKAWVYNSSGVEIKKVDKDDFHDVSAISGYSLYEDNRLIYSTPNASNYPYTVKYKYVIEYSSLIGYPVWVPILFEQVALQSGTFNIIVPSTRDFRYQAFNFKNSEPTIVEEDGNRKYTWYLENISTAEVEPYSRGHQDAVPFLITAPNRFSYEGYSGSMETWDDYAQWYYMLNQGRDMITEETRAKVKDLVTGKADREEKIRAVYEYLQNTTRYVSIQLGIGGFQSFPADVTAENGYGDCKALTTYTMGMLKSIGIDSYYALVRAGRNAIPIRSEFPSSQFNHVFLCVPNEQDTIWLECTSQTNPFGYLGTFTSDREVLIVHQNGGKIVHTPKYSENENTQLRTAHVKIGPEGNARASIKTIYRGTQFENDNINYKINDATEDQKKWLYQKLDLQNFEINDFELSEDRSMVPSITEDLDLTIKKLASVSGKRIFLKPNLMNQWTNIPTSDTDRKSEIYLRSSWSDTDSIVYSIPEGFYVEHNAGDKKIESEFGEYEVKVYQEKSDEIIYVRKMTKKSGTFPASSYDEYIDFLKRVTRADKTKIVLVNKT